MRIAMLMTAAAILFFVPACSESTQEKGEGLFGELEPATPNKLRGVYSMTADVTSNEKLEMRLRFTDDSVIGGSRCVKEGTPPVLAAGEAGLATEALDAPTGEITVERLLMQQGTCEAGLPAGTYSFKVEEMKLTLWIQDQPLERVFGKVGD